MQSFGIVETSTAMENVFDERFPRCSPIGFTVEELRKSMRIKLLEPIRFLGTTNSAYVDLEVDHLAQAYFTDDTQKNCELIHIILRCLN